MNMPKVNFHFISHTHWDREWYLPFERFRYRLVQLIDHLLELLDADPEFKYFHLDGQTIVLEDYLKIRPSQRERLEAHIGNGRILIGPWYQQNDLFLTSGESTVRNLMEGIRLSRALGGEMKVGYLPDHFGLIGQMPQIFRGVGLDNAVFGRGYSYRKHGSTTIHWRSPDGSEVVGILMAHWYNNAQRLPEDREQLKQLFATMKAREEETSPIPHHLMMNGVDHLEAQENLPHVLQSLRELFDEEHHFIHDTLPNYVQSIIHYIENNKSLSIPVLEGELREREDYDILGGTLSSRVYLKQANVECHHLLEKWIEPLSAWCAMNGLDPYDSEYIRSIWKLYMENHPHDSICGCSQDAVHDHMMDRYASIREVADEIIDRKLEVLIRQIGLDVFDKGDQKLLVANTSQQTSSAVIQTAVYFLAEDEVGEFRLEDELGNSVAYRLISSEPSRVQVLSPINLPGILQVRRYDIEWQPEVPQMGYATYRVRAGQQGTRVADRIQSVSHVLENSRIKVEVKANGTFDVTDKECGTVSRGLGVFADAGDSGDLYVFKQVAGEKERLWDEKVEWLYTRSNEFYDECSYRFTWELPAGLEAGFMRRKKTVAACEFQVTLRLDKQTTHLNVRVEINNEARDHRIRLLFPLPQKVENVWAGAQFDIVQRSWNEGLEWNRDCNAQPFWKWLAPLYGNGGLAIFSKGLFEYEMVEKGNQAAVTLLRCVETINVREAISLENDIQPKGQCIGKHTFELAIRPFAYESSTQLYQEAELFNQGVRTKLTAVEDPRWGQGRAWVQDTKLTGTFTRPDPNENKERLPMSKEWISLEGNAIVSAVKWAEDGQGLIVRLFNAESNVSPVRFKLAKELRRAVRTNLIEEEQSELPISNHAIHIEIEPKKIETIKLYL